MTALQFLTWCFLVTLIHASNQDKPKCEAKTFSLVPQEDSSTTLGTATIQYYPISKQLCLQHRFTSRNPTISILFSVQKDDNEEDEENQQPTLEFPDLESSNQWIPSALVATSGTMDGVESLDSGTEESCVVLTDTSSCNEKLKIGLRAKVEVNGQAWYKSLAGTNYTLCCPSNNTCDLRNCTAACKANVAIRSFFVQLQFQIDYEKRKEEKELPILDITKQKISTAKEGVVKGLENGGRDAATIMMDAFQPLHCCRRLLRVVPVIDNAVDDNKNNNNENNDNENNENNEGKEQRGATFLATFAFLPSSPSLEPCPSILPPPSLPPYLSLLSLRTLDNHEEIRENAIDLVELLEEEEKESSKGSSTGKGPTKKVGTARWIGLMYVFSVITLGIALGVVWCWREKQQQPRVDRHEV